MKGTNNNDHLAQLFRKLPSEDMPAGLKSVITERVAAEKRHKRLSSDAKGIMIAAFVSFALISGVLLLFRYTGISLDLFRLDLSGFDLSGGRYTTIVAVALLALAMLVAETLVSRRMVRKRLEEN